MITLHYGSIMQSKMLQDIEQMIFDDEDSAEDDLEKYLGNRLDEDFDGIYVCMEYDSKNLKIHEELPECFITRDRQSAIDWISAIGAIDVKIIYEFDTYEDALEYLKLAFETSSKMYEQ